MQTETTKPLYKVLNERRENKGWRQGQTLPTKHTNKWSVEQWMANDEVEMRILFSNFREEDEGRSRVKIAVFENITDAQYTAIAVNNLAGIAQALENLLKHEGLFKQFAAPEGQLLDDIQCAKNALNKIS